MNWFSALLDNLNYWTIMILMAIESSLIPFPSEVVVPPAAYHAAGGHLNVVLIVVFATIGSNIGAIINYALGYYLGRPAIYKFANSRWGHICLLNQEKVEKSEKYFDEHGMIATITGRLIPAVRQLISLPAGMAKMNFWKFILYTTIGAGTWNCVLATMGWYLHSIVPEEQLTDKIMEYSEHIKIAIFGIIIIVIVVLTIKWWIKRKKNN